MAETPQTFDPDAGKSQTQKIMVVPHNVPAKNFEIFDILTVKTL